MEYRSVEKYRASALACDSDVAFGIFGSKGNPDIERYGVWILQRHFAVFFSGIKKRNPPDESRSETTCPRDHPDESGSETVARDLSM